MGSREVCDLGYTCDLDNRPAGKARQAGTSLAESPFTAAEGPEGMTGEQEDSHHASDPEGMSGVELCSCCMGQAPLLSPSTPSFLFSPCGKSYTVAIIIQSVAVPAGAGVRSAMCC